MFTRTTGKFDSIEFAELAAKHIRDSVSSTAKISIIHNRKHYKGSLKNKELDNATHGKVFFMLPTAISSYNYITDTISRSVNKSLIAEPLLDRSVTLVVQADGLKSDIISGIIASYGGYDVRKQ